MNQLSFHVSKEKFRKKGLVLNSKIDKDIKDTLKLLSNIWKWFVKLQVKKLSHS